MPSLPAPFLVLIASTFPALAQLPMPQQPTQQELAQLRAAKLAKPAFAKGTWSFDFDAARARAGREGKAILVWFTTSCTPNPQCDALEDGLLADPAFVEFAAAFVPFVHVTSRVEGEPYADLLHRTGPAILPSLCFLDAEGKLLAVQRPLELPALRATGAKVQALLAARAAAAKAPGPAAEKALFLAEFDLGRIPADQVGPRLGKVELTAAERQAIDPALVDVELVLVVRGTTNDNRTEMAARIAALHAAGRRPTDAGALQFWGFVLFHAAKSKNGALADEAYAELVRRESKSKDLMRNLQAREKWQDLVNEAKQK
ncbi:MAG: thioredoxin family protein [Planctomycetes bacterium]|nr:thioredoxin family protein [Planctomycetota bacterium]